LIKNFFNFSDKLCSIFLIKRQRLNTVNTAVYRVRAEAVIIIAILITARHSSLWCVMNIEKLNLWNKQCFYWNFALC